MLRLGLLGYSACSRRTPAIFTGKTPRHFNTSDRYRLYQVPTI